VSAALRFCEDMRGYVSFGDLTHRSGYERGREDGTRLRLKLRIVVDDVDRFIAGPERRAVLRGSVQFDELGGSFEIQRGQLRLLPGRADAQLQGRMYYCVGVRIDKDQWLTVRGVKTLKRDRGSDSWADLTSLHTRVLHGPPRLDRTEDQVYPDEAGATIATGIVRVTLPGLAASLATFRPKARDRITGGLAVARFCAAIVGGVGDVYLPRPLEWTDDEEDKPVTVTAEPEPVIYESDPWPSALTVTTHPLKVIHAEATAASPEEAVHVKLERVRNPDDPDGRNVTKGPVLLVAGSSVGSAIFRPAGAPETIVHRLLRDGYDVWVENWRGSLGQDPLEYSLDEAAVLDHPAAVDYILEQTGADTMKAVVHCLGSSSFMLSLAAGMLGEKVTHVVSNSVSLHPVLPLGAEVKIRTLVPIYERATRWLDPQWARDAMTDEEPGAPRAAARNLFTDALVAWVRLVHREGPSDVRNFAHFMYGSGPSTLFDESTLDPETREWLENQLSWAPIRLYRQISRSLLAGHLVPLQEWDERLPGDVFETGPAENDALRITFITGTENRTFSPRSQQRTHEWFERYQPGQHVFRPLEGFGHLDVWLRPDAAPVFEEVIEGLERS
jgi:pimeloyl-ACP methyl ester carboxylesterase